MEVHFPVEAEELPLEALRLEQFYFPLMLRCGGLLLAALAFLAEVIFKRRGTQQ